MVPRSARAWISHALILFGVALAGLGSATPAFAEEWVQNFVPTELWSGPAGQAISFGTAPRWDYFEVVAPMGNGRIYVRVVRTNGFAYIDAANIGPSGAPPLGWPAGTLDDPALAEVPAPALAPAPAPVTSAPGSPVAVSSDPALSPATSALVTSPPSAAGPVQPSTGIASQAAIGPVPGYAIKADAALWPALQALDRVKHTWTLEALASTGTRLSFGALPAEAAALYEPRDGEIVFNGRWARSDPRALAALVEHEAKHVADVLAGIDVYTPSGCLTTEVNAFNEEAKTWGELVGPKGKADPRDDLERSLNYKLSLLQRGPDAIRGLILQNPGYRAECQLR